MAYLATDPNAANPFSMVADQTPLPSSIPPTPLPSTAGAPPANAVAGWYQQYLGRAPESQSVTDAWAGQGAAAEQGIANSPEAKAYAAAHAAPAAGAAGASTGAATGAGGLTTPNFGTSGTGWQARPRNPLYDQLLQQLQVRSSADPYAVDPNDPLIQRQTDAYSADQTRAGRQFLTKTAEAAGPYGSTNAETRHAGEVTGRNTADFRSQLVQRQVDSRRADIASALNGELGLLTADEQSRLREEDQALAEKTFGANAAQQAWQDQYQTMFGA